MDPHSPAVRSLRLLAAAAALSLLAASLQAGEAFISPAEPSGSVTVKLYPTENVAAGSSVLVTFGFPFPRGSVTAAGLSKLRVLKGGVEVPAYVAQLTPWRHATNSVIDGASVRVARIQIRNTFATVYPGYESIVVEWGLNTRTQNVATLTNPRSAWHTVTSGSYVASDGVAEPDVYAVLPSAHLSKGLFRPMRTHPLEASVAEARANPSTMAATATWPRYLEQEHAAVDNFYTIINEDDSRVTEANRCPYKTDYEPWLYDRGGAMYALYFRSGFFKALREAVRNTEFYRTQIYPGSTTPASAIGGFKLKTPSPSSEIDSKYSYNESLAYSYWVTGDDVALPYIDWIVTAHKNASAPVRWSPSLNFWTERDAGFRLLASVVAFEVTGSSTYRSNLLSGTADLVWHQNGAGGAIPSSRVDGGLYHYGSQHGDGTPSALVASSWMSALIQDAMVRAYAFTEDATIAAFIRRLGTFLQAATKSDRNHMYEADVLAYPDYMTRYDGVSDERDGTECEHALETAAAAGWSVYFADLTGQSSTSLRQLVASLYTTYDWGVSYWIRPSGPASGLPAFRVSPWRKYGWEHRPAGSLSWSLGGAAYSRPQKAWQSYFAVNTLETPMVGDFNGDGKTDIITFTRQNPAAVGDVYVALSSGTEFGPSAKWNDWFAVTTDETVVIGDFDGDGNDDIATWLGRSTRQVYVARSYGNAMSPSTVWLNSIGYDPTDVPAAGDVNGDGRDDLVLFARRLGRVYVALSTGSSFSAPTQWHSFFAVSTYERPVVADVNGDNKADIVTFATDSPTAQGDVYVATSTGTKFVDQNGVANSSSKWHDWFAVQPTEQVRTGDLNGDNRDDFFTFLPLPWGQAYTVNSLGTSMAPNVLWRELVVFDPSDKPFVGDVNGDGKADIIVFAQGEGKVYVSLAQ